MVMVEIFQRRDSMLFQNDSRVTLRAVRIVVLGAWFGSERRDVMDGIEGRRRGKEEWRRRGDGERRGKESSRFD
jgi:hypothetical protein